MYQSIFYNFKDRTVYLRDDKEGWLNFQYKPTYFRIDAEGDYKTLDGRRVSPTDRYVKGDPDLLETDIPPETRTLVDLYKGNEEPPSFHNILFLDIEIEIGDTLTPQNIKKASTQVTAIALYDVNTKQYLCYVLDESKRIKSTSKENKIIIPCENEEQLLSKFLNKWEEIDPTIIIGYNSEFFDIPYLYFRIEKILGSKDACRLSPLGIVAHTNEYGAYGQYDADYITLAGVNHLDYMLLHKKYITKQEPSYKLGEIGEKYVQLGKIEYHGSLDKLFTEDPDKFIEYNLRDVEILVALDNKLQFVDLTLLICHSCHVAYNNIYYATALNEGAILDYLKSHNIVSPNKPTTTNFLLKTVNTEDSYAGGYLKEPLIGLHEDLGDIDAVSLYPSNIKSLNLGIETLVGRIVTGNNFEQNCSLEKLKERDPEETITIEKLNIYNYLLEPTDIKLGKLIKYIEKNKFTIAASGSFYRTDIESVASKILKIWFTKRNDYKSLRNKEGKAKNWEKYKFYNLRQEAFKILQVSLYGTYAQNGWRYTDGHKIISAAITNSGQRLIQESISYVNKIMNEELGTNKDYVVAGDTDSAFVQIRPLLLKRYPELDLTNRTEKNKAILTIFADVQKQANLNLDRISKELFNVQGKHYFELKQELIIERAYWSGKRRYALYVVNKEGVEMEELVLMGLDLMKSNFPKLFRTFGEDIIKKIMFGAKKKDIDRLILDFKKSIPSRSLKEIAKPTGVTQVRAYIERKPKSGELFSVLKSKTPINAKSAIYYNDIINFKGIKGFSEIRDHDKIYWVYLKPNPYRINSLAFFGAGDPPEIIKFIEEYVDKEKTFDSTFLNKLENMYKDIGWTLPSMNENVSKFFVFK